MLIIILHTHHGNFLLIKRKADCSLDKETSKKSRYINITPIIFALFDQQKEQAFQQFFTNYSHLITPAEIELLIRNLAIFIKKKEHNQLLIRFEPTLYSFACTTLGYFKTQFTDDKAVREWLKSNVTSNKQLGFLFFNLEQVIKFIQRVADVENATTNQLLPLSIRTFIPLL